MTLSIVIGLAIIMYGTWFRRIDAQAFHKAKTFTNAAQYSVNGTSEDTYEDEDDPLLLSRSASD